MIYNNGISFLNSNVTISVSFVIFIDEIIFHIAFLTNSHTYMEIITAQHLLFTFLSRLQEKCCYIDALFK